MIELLIDGISWLLLMAGVVLSIIGGIGMHRFPDVYSRMHAAGITDTLGAGLVVAGLMVQAGFTQASIKLLLILGFLLFTSPVATHALANAAYSSGLMPWLPGKDRPSSNT